MTGVDNDTWGDHLAALGLEGIVRPERLGGLGAALRFESAQVH